MAGPLGSGPFCFLAAYLRRRGGGSMLCEITGYQSPVTSHGVKMSDLASKQCVPCRGGVPALKGSELDTLTRMLGGGWKVINEHHLEKNYAFPDFRQALDFTNRVGEVAEEQGHHPDIYLAWGKVIITIWTHAIDGLTESDFILAAKADQVLGPAGRATHGAPAKKP
jgi:4a-hydroxytetrahydrobiopterin dehydratase